MENICRLPVVLFFLLSGSFFTSVNAQVVTHSGAISQNTVWESTDVHLVTGDVTVNAGVTLTIEPGAIVKFNTNRRLVISGVLSAVGTLIEPIIFTSYRDDTAGGDTNNDGPSTAAQGDWYYLQFTNTVTDSLTRLEFVDIRYGGGQNNNFGSILISDASPTITNSRISDSERYGIYIAGGGSSPLIDTVFIDRTGWSGIANFTGSTAVLRNNSIREAATGIYVDNANPRIDGNTITHNRDWGIDYRFNNNSTLVITNNTITHNRLAVRLPVSAVPNPADGNTLVPNQRNGVWIRGGNLSRDLQFERAVDADSGAELNTYHINGTLSLLSGATLTIDPGVIVKFATSSAMSISGNLQAVGTAENKIAFTSDRDDRIGGDFNSNGTATVPNGGNWHGITFNNAADDNSRIAHATVRYGGSNGSGNIYASQANVSIENTVVSHSSTHGIRVVAASPTLTGNEIYANRWDGISPQSSGTPVITNNRIYANMSDGIHVTANANAVVTDNEIFGNAGQGLFNQSSATVQAPDNWWGAADGPAGDGPGSGDAISGNIDISGLLGDSFQTSGTQFSYINAGPNITRGTLPGAVVVQGEDTEQWGTAASTRLLFDVNRVILDYLGLDASEQYDVILTYYNPDDTTAAGGTIQRLADAAEASIHDSVLIPRSIPTAFKFQLPQSAYSDGNLRLNFIRENGLRASVAQAWIIERNSSDTAAASSSISSPANGAQLTGGQVEIQGSASDSESGVALVEVGIDDGNGIVWRPVSQLRSDGGWSYLWNLPADGNYQLYSRAVDAIGNIESATVATNVVVNQNLPEAISQLVAFDTPQDGGGSINIQWTLSADDGANAADVSSYEIERREVGEDSFANVGSVAAGAASFIDSSVVSGTEYEYQIITIDLAGNRTASDVFGPVIAIDNNLPDTTAPEEVTDLTATAGNGLVLLSWTAGVDTAQDQVDQLLDISIDGGASWGSNAPDYNDGNVISLGMAATNYLVNNLVNDTAYRFRLRTVDGASPANISAGVITDAITPSTTAFTTVSGTLSSDTVWQTGVYFVSGNLTINSGVTLDIRPGVIVKFGSRRQMTVNGRLLANGVTFTAWTDDSVGGDNNGDGASVGTAGYWRYIQFNNSAASRLLNSTVRYGGDATAQIYTTSGTSDLQLIGNTIAFSGTRGIHFDHTTTTLLQNNTIVDNATEGVYIDNQGGRPIITGNTFSRNNNGIRAGRNGPLSIEDNIISDNNNYGIFYDNTYSLPPIRGNTISGNNVAMRIPFSGLPNPDDNNTFANNTHNVIEVRGNTRTEDLTLSATGINVYYVVDGAPIVATGVSMRIEPGVIMKFGVNDQLRIDGALSAIGTADEPIIFTSYRDDSAGGDTNRDGITAGVAGDWYYIQFTNAVIDFATRLEHIDVRYGGGQNNNFGNLLLSDASPTIINSRISDSERYGIYIAGGGSSPLIENVEINRTGWSGIANFSSSTALLRNNSIREAATGIYVDNANPRIDGNTITHNRDWGIDYRFNNNSTPVITNNTITHNRLAVRLPVSAVPNPADGNTLVPNQRNGVWIRGGNLSRDLQFERAVDADSGAELNTYHINGTLSLLSGATLTIDPGVIVKFATSSAMSISGNLQAVGTAENKIAFTSDRDDRIGGDFNSNGTATVPNGGNWHGITFNNAADDNSRIAHATVRYGGSNGSGNIYASQANVSIENTVVSHSSTHGIRVVAASPTLTGNEIYANRWDGISPQSSGTPVITNNRIYANMSDGIHVTANANAVVTDNEIFGNAGQGLFNQSSATVQAPDNWWGAADGPAGDGPGSGDAISGNIDISGLLGDSFQTSGTQFSYINAGPNITRGTLPGAVVVQGEDTEQWGTAASTRLLFDVNRVILDYLGLDASEQYDVILTYYNPDDTTAAGGTIQRLADAAEASIHDSVLIPRSIPTAFKFQLPQSAYSDGNLRLNFIRENGLRASVAQAWIIERNSSDTAAASSSISSPANGAQLTGGQVEIQGSASDSESGVALVEVGIDDGNGIVWRPVSQLRSDGGWSYLWNLPADGNYQLYSRAVDSVGNIGLATTALSVIVNQTAPAAVTDPVAFDTPQDDGNSITLSWRLSIDDGANSNDVANYEILRRPLAGNAFISAGIVAANTNSLLDNAVSTGIEYEYQVITIDLAGNRTASDVFGPVIAIDNNLPDTTAPEEVTDLTATAGNGLVLLSWTAGVDTAQDQVDQLLDISIDGGASWGSNAPDYNDGNVISLGMAATNYLVNNLVNDTAYRFRLRTVDGASPANISAGVITDAITPSTTAFTTVSGTLSSDTVWQTGVYFVSGNLTINSGVTLDIRPGVIVKFGSRRQMTVNGRLLANGVTFTAWTDDSVGGDNNGDGASVGTAGYWRYIQFNNSAASRLLNSTVRYGGDATAQIYTTSGTSDLQLIGNTIAFSGTRGIHFDHTTTTLLQNNTIVDNATEGVYIDNQGGRPIITGNTFSRNNNGIRAGRNGPLSIEDNIISDNNNYGIFYDNTYSLPPIRGNTISGNNVAMRIPFSGLPNPDDNNTFANNTHNVIEVRGNTRTEDLTLSATGINVYYVVDGAPIVATGVSMRIEPGVIMKFGVNDQLRIDGALSAIGTADEPIIFTSYRDDSAGGDTNRDGITAGVAGDWYYIQFTNAVIDFATRLEHIDVRYGGGQNNNFGNLLLSDASPTIINSRISDSERYGIYIAGGGSSPLIENVEINRTGWSGIANFSSSTALLRNNSIREAATGIYVDNANPRIDGNTITHNRDWGIDYRFNNNSTPVITNNTITHNRLAVRLPVSAVPNPADGNTLVPNQRNGVWIRGGNLSRDLQFERAVDADSGAELNTYHINGTLSLLSGATLTIDPGVIVKFATSSAMSISGNLQAVGTAENKIAFTSDRDDRIGGDFNSNGTATVPNGGNWHGITFNNAADDNSRIAHATVRYGGSNGSGNIYTNQANITVESTVVSHSSTHGIRSVNASPNLTGNEVYANRWDGISPQSSGTANISNSRIYGNLSDGVHITPNANANINANEIFGNAGFGINNTSSNTVQAQDNWWGAVDGPAGDGPGSGDGIVGNVDISGLLGDDIRTDGSEFSFFNAGGIEHRNFGLVVPQVSGTASTELGTAVFQSFLEESETQQISVEYTGLSVNANYRLLVTYLEPSNEDSIQEIITESGIRLQPAVSLPGTTPLIYEFVVPKDAIESSNLRFNINATQGFRAKVSGLFLVQDTLTDNVPPVIDITAPADNSSVGAGNITIQGNVSDDASDIVELSILITPASADTIALPVTSVNSAGNWSLNWQPAASGDYSISARVIDSNGNVTELSNPVNIRVDQDTPAAVNNLAAISASSRVRVLWDLSEDDQAGDQDVIQYRVLRSTSPVADFTQVGQLNAGSTQFDDNSSLPDTDYFYQVATVDQAGNSTLSNAVGPVSLSADVDTLAPEDVTNLSVALTQSGGANSSALLRWTPSANTEGDLSDQRLYISTDGGTTFGNNAPSYNNGGFISLGRTARSTQISQLNIGSDYRFRLTVVDEVPNESAGVAVDASPTGAATEVAQLSGTISEDMHLNAGVFRINNNLTVASGVTLSLDPGVIFKFNSGRQLTVNGRLLADGVVFTAWTDDEFGGDSNGDGASAGTPGYWRYIIFSNSVDSRLDGNTIRFAGNNTASVFVGSGTSNLAIVNNTIVQSGTRGIYHDTNNASTLIEDNSITDNVNEGVYVQSGRPLIIGNTFSRNSHGIRARFNAPTRIENNIITDNTGYGIFFDNTYSMPPIRGNTITGNNIAARLPFNSLPNAEDNNVLAPNNFNTLEYRSNIRTTSLSLPASLVYYQVTSGAAVMATNTVLTVEAGTVWKFVPGAELNISGAMIAEGELQNKIIFTSSRDDSQAGDTNRDGDATVAVNGNWNGIDFFDSLLEEQSVLNHVQIRYAGNADSAALYIRQADITVENSEIANSASNGIRIDRASPTITGSRIWGNRGDGIHIEFGSSNPTITFNRISTNASSGVRLRNSARATLTNNQIFLNRGFGVRNDTSSVVIDASQSWWGDLDSSGPLNADSNPSGAGSEVSNGVTFEPFIIDAPIEYGYVNFNATAVTSTGSIAEPVLVQGTLSNEWSASSQNPDRTMAWNADRIIVDYTGLDPAKRYKVRSSYFNGDAAAVFQSLTDGNGNEIHPSQLMPTGTPVQYEFSIPQAFYSTGDIRLEFVHDNPTTSVRAAIPEIWLLEDIPELTPPLFESVAFNDIDGDGAYSLGDELYFHFSEAMNTAQIQTGTTDANTRLASDTGAIYGNVNQTRWSADEFTVIVTLTEGFSVTGVEFVTPSGLSDLFGNAAIGTQALSTQDTVAPALIGLEWLDNDADVVLSVGDQYRFIFNEAMDSSVITNNSIDANAQLRPEGGLRYGNINAVAWDTDTRAVTITITEGFSIAGDERVIPSGFITDIAGNSVTGSVNLLGRDSTPPLFTGVAFDDADGSGTVTLGDSYHFTFNEPMRRAALSDRTTEGNLNLIPGDNRRWGNINRLSWNADATRVSVEITSGFTVNGSELVAPSAFLTDEADNTVANSIQLTLIDTVAPGIERVQPNFISPVSATDGYRITVQFDSSMDISVRPQITLSSTATEQPVVPAEGEWLTSFYPNDTYVTAAITLTQGMDGQLTAGVSDAQDWTGNVMLAVANAFTATLDATAPAHPAVNLAAQSCSSATLDWQGFSANSDVAGFQVYRSSTGEFTQINGSSFIRLLDPQARSVEVTDLALNTQYHLAIAAMDGVGNFIPDIVSLPVLIAEQIPAPVNFTASAGLTSDQVVLDWSGYDSSPFCGFAGYHVYLETSDFTQVDALTPVATLAADASSTTLSGLDRTQTYYLAVVGFNSSDGLNNNVVTTEWSDPFTGTIAVDTVIGAGDEKQINIDQAIVVTNGATLTVAAGTTLRFAPGTSIDVSQGTLLIEGTVFDPVHLTSAQNIDGSTPNAGDWNAIVLGPLSTGSILQHAVIEYGQGLVLDGSTATIEALTAQHNSGAAITLRNAASLTAADFLLQFNDVGVAVESNAQLTLANSVVKNNAINAQSDNSVTPNLQSNWWGVLTEAEVQATTSGSVDIQNFLSSEPVLSPAVGILDDDLQVIEQTITLRLPGRNAAEMRFSEDSSFSNVFFDAWQPEAAFTLSANGGEKTIFAQYRSITGEVSETVSVTLNLITEGPSISGFNITDGQVLGRPITIAAQATSVLGIAELAFLMDDVVIQTVSGNALEFRWDIRNIADGLRRLSISATDNAGNISSLARNVQIQVAPPAAPVITSPSNGSVFGSETDITVQGTAEPGIGVSVRRNGFVVGTPVADDSGQFSIAGVTIEEGDSAIQATAVDTIGVSAQSNTVTVTVDTGAPETVTLSALPRPQGAGIDFVWRNPLVGEVPEVVRLYRALTPITTTAGATLLVEQAEDDYFDRPTADGTYYYVAVGVDSAGNVSALSNMIVYEHDRTAPQLEIAFDQSSPVGPGQLQVTITANEALQDIPSLSFKTGASNIPNALILVASAENEYQGTIDIDAAFASGAVQFTASAIDVAGNRFNGSPQGDALILDTQGPVAAIHVVQAAPIQNQNTVDVNLNLTLDEPARVGSLPVLQFTPPEGGAITVSLLGEGTDWTGLLRLDSSAGSGFGQFTISVEDAFGNVGDTISSGASLELFNTDTPTPPAVPATPTVQALPAGQVALDWAAVELAETYNIYRDSGDCSAEPVQLIAEGITDINFNDLPATDGQYCYAISSERRDAESALSTAVTVIADRVAPGIPQNFSVNLGNQGVILEWLAPAGEEPSQYSVQRNNAVFRNLNGGEANYQVTDQPGIGGSFLYSVIARDAAGNESVTADINLDLLVGAVSDLQVIVGHNETPVLTWTNNDPNVVAYDVYKGDVKLTPAPITVLEFQDVNYAGNSRVTYGVVALDSSSQESPIRQVDVYPVTLNAQANLDSQGVERALLANYFSVFDIEIQNRESTQTLNIASLDVRMSVNAEDSFTDSVNLNQVIAPAASIQEQVTIPIGNTVNNHLLHMTAIQTDISGNEVHYQRSLPFDDVVLSEDMATVSLGDVPLAGGFTTATVCLTNHGYAAIDILAAREFGRAAGDIYVSIIDGQGLEISRGEFIGLPAGSIPRSNGDIIKTLAPQETVCVDISVLVPGGLTEGTELTFTGIVEQVSNGDLSAGTGGLISGGTQSGITLSPYFGIAQVAADTFANDEGVTVTGQILNRDTNQPEANAPFKLGFEVKGYKFFVDLVADAEGNFSYEYLPIPGLSGEFLVWAAHPSVFDTLNQDSFSFFRMYASPDNGQIRSSQADSIDFNIELINPNEIDINSLSLDFRAFTVDGEGNEIDEPRLQGELIIPNDWRIDADGQARITLRLSADLDAPNNSTVEYTLRSAEGAAAVFTASVNLSDAVPALRMTSPRDGFVNISLDRGSTRVVPVTVKNTGLRSLEDAVLSLPPNLSWITANLPLNEEGNANLGDIEVGEEFTFDVLISPPADIEFGFQNDSFTVTGSNSSQTTNLNIFALITSAEEGDVQFNVFNILGRTVENASVRLSNDTLQRRLDTVRTDANGQVIIEDLNLGQWNYQVSAAGHHTASGVIEIQADQLIEETVELNKSLVTVNFNVVPVPFEDRYEVVIEQTFETRVPVPLLVVDPPFIEFDNVLPGFEVIVPVKVSNFGLKALDDVTLSSQDTGVAALIPMISYIPRLNAQETVEVPYRIIYRGESAQLPGASLVCGVGPNLADFLAGLNSIIKGSSSSAFSQQELNALANIAVALTAVPTILSCSGVTPGPTAAGCLGTILLLTQDCGVDIGGPSQSNSQSSGPYTNYQPGNGNGNTGCFVEGTPILMADGSRKPIEKIALRDEVLTFNNTQGAVTRVYKRETDHLRELRYRNVKTGQLYRVETTDEHHFWLQNRENWVFAGELKVGDVLALPDGQFARIELTERRAIDTVVYNFDVEDYQSYYANDALVYQQCGMETDQTVTEQLQSWQKTQWQENPFLKAAPQQGASK